MNTTDLNPIHEMLRFNPESPKESLTLTVRESDQNRIRNQRRVAFLTCNDETHPFEYLIDAVQTVTKMLCNYPAPVSINGREIRREPVPNEPSIIHQPAHRPDETKPPNRELGHPRNPVLLPRINIDGINYQEHYRGEWAQDSIHIPNPDVADGMRQYCDHYRIHYHHRITTPADSQDNFVVESNEPYCEISPGTAQLIEESKEAANQQAMQIIGTQLTLENIKQIATHQDWQHNTVMPAEGVTPVTIEFDRNEHREAGKYQAPLIYRPKRPMCDSVAAHLAKNPQLGLLPITPPLDDDDFHNLNCLEIRIMEGPSRRSDPVHSDNDFRAASIDVDIIIEKPNAPSRQMTLELESIFLGDIDNPQPILLRHLDVDVEELTQQMFEAYHHYPFIPREADEKRATEFLEKARATAQRAVAGNTHAYLEEVRSHWHAFAPHTPRPESVTDQDLAATMATTIAESERQEHEEPPR